MIELITGQPGAGKTLFALTRIEEKARKEGRPVFYSGIKDLALPWTEIDPEKWTECPAGSIIVIDECQRVLRPRMHGAKVPAYVEGMETHRHQGHDIVLITQHPMLLDANVRRLVGLHFHVVRSFGFNKATVHEWAGVKENCDKSRDDSTRHDFRYPKKVFEWYQSAQIHTHKPRLPARVLVLVAVLILVPALGYRMYTRWQERADAPEVAEQASLHAVAHAEPQPARSGGSKALTQSEYLEAHRPRVVGLDYTAPIYDGVTKPTHAPYPAACVSSQTRCTCYSQQGTRLAVPVDLCASIVSGGFFLAWDTQTARPQAVSGPKPPAEKLDGEGAASWISLGGERARVAAVSPPSKAMQSATGGKRGQSVE